MILAVLTATAFAQTPDGMNQAILLHVGSWIAQFLGHGLAEKRAPALLDNLLGGELLRLSTFISSQPIPLAVVLAPFFVHLEILFGVGYRPEFHRHIKNEIGKEIVRIRTAQGDEKRRKEL